MYGIVKGIRRHRYIKFHVKTIGRSSSPTKLELIQALRTQTWDVFSKDVNEMGLWLVCFDGTTGIVKCKYQEKEHIIQLLHSLKKIGSKHVELITYATSGTIRGLTQEPLEYSQDL